MFFAFSLETNRPVNHFIQEQQRQPRRNTAVHHFLVIVESYQGVVAA